MITSGITGSGSLLLQQTAENASVNTDKLKRDASSGEDERLRKACGDFEAIFIKQMLDSMRKTVNKTELLGGGMAENIFEDMLYDKYAEKMSSTGNFGLKEMLYRQLSTVSASSILQK